MMRLLTIIVAFALSGCATIAVTTSTSTPVFNRDGSITFNEDGDYPKEITIEVRAKAGPLGTLESWMLDTDVTRDNDGITFHTGNTGKNLTGLDPEALAALIMGLLQALAAAP